MADFNHRAQQLYLNMGFEVVRRIPQESNGDIHLFVEMEKTPNFRLCCKATEKLVDSQEKVVQYTYDCWWLAGNLSMITNKQKEKTMTFEEILPGLKAKKNMCVQAGVGRKTTSSSLIRLSRMV